MNIEKLLKYRSLVDKAKTARENGDSELELKLLLEAHEAVDEILDEQGSKL